MNFPKMIFWQLNLTDRAVSLIRTYVPIWVGLGLTFLQDWLEKRFGLFVSIDSATAGALGVAICSSLYYTLARALEKKWPKLGVLLGHRGQPFYFSELQAEQTD